MVHQVVRYLSSSKEELKKVTWPKQEETVKKTVLVVIISLLAAVYLGVLDYILNVFLELLL